MSIAEEKAEVKEVLKFSFKVINFTEDYFGHLYSEEFCFAKGKWYVRVDAEKENSDFVGIFLNKVSGETVTVSCKTSILVEEEIINAGSIIYTYKEIIGYGWAEFISRKDLFKKISPHFSFTVICEVQVVDDPKFDPSIEFKISSQLRDVCDKNFHDLKIQVKDSDQILSAHRNIVSAYSTVLYEEILKLSGSDYLKIENFGFETVQEVLNFIYGKKVNKTDENVKKILLAAKKYDIENLQIECEKFIFQKLTAENAFENLTFAHENDVTNLLKEIVSFADKNIDDLLKNQKIQWEKVVAEHPRITKILFQEFMESRSEKFKNYTTKLRCSKRTATANCSNVDNSVLGKNYEYLFESMSFSDVVLKVEGKELKAHKCILISQSKVFRAMFSHDTLESNENRIEITDIDYDTMKQLLQYIYCGKVTGLEENAVNLFSAADKYDLMEFKDLCKNSMEQNVTVENVTEILKLADLHPSYLADSKEIALRFFKKNFESVFVTKEWDNFAESNARILSEILIKFMDDLKKFHFTKRPIKEVPKSRFMLSDQ